MSILQQINSIPNDWKGVIMSYPSINELNCEIENMYRIQTESSEDEMILRIFPERENIFRCFSYCDPSEIKVVIIGQDPYHGEGQATELLKDLGKENDDSTLEKWAKQGVLLLNSALTVREHCPAIHAKLWKPFTEYILKYLNERTQHKIFVAWGAFAYNCLFNKNQNLDTDKHKLIVSSHPSPLSANKCFQIYPKFVDSKPFTKINGILIELNKTPIQW